LGIAIAVGAIGYLAWHWLKPESLPPGLVSANGGIEATDIDVATKTPGRVQDILVNEGDFVTAAQVLVRMNTD
jgi:HlyD family secretion protein